LKHIIKKNFGQNFLVDSFVVESIIMLTDYKKNDCIIEVGPGKGALTDFLIDSKLELNVLAIELDKTLIPYLKKKYTDNNITIVQGDAVKLDLNQLCDGVFHPQAQWRLIGNLPYNISTPLLFKLIPFRDKIKDQFFMLQNEVVDRMVAEPGTKIYGRLSVILQALYKMNKILLVKPESFRPAPKVTSAFIKMQPDNNLFQTIKSWEAFSFLVTSAFSSRRKTIKNNFKNFLDVLDFERVEANLTHRAENISVRDYIELANQIATKKSKNFFLEES